MINIDLHKLSNACGNALDWAAAALASKPTPPPKPQHKRQHKPHVQPTVTYIQHTIVYMPINVYMNDSQQLAAACGDSSTDITDLLWKKHREQR